MHEVATVSGTQLPREQSMVLTLLNPSVYSHFRMFCSAEVIFSVEVTLHVCEEANRKKGKRETITAFESNARYSEFDCPYEYVFTQPVLILYLHPIVFQLPCPRLIHGRRLPEDYITSTLDSRIPTYQLPLNLNNTHPQILPTDPQTWFSSSTECPSLRAPSVSLPRSRSTTSRTSSSSSTSPRAHTRTLPSSRSSLSVRFPTSCVLSHYDVSLLLPPLQPSTSSPPTLFSHHPFTRESCDQRVVMSLYRC